LDIFCYGVRKYIGKYIAVLNGVDAVVFTAGIGENNAYIRREVLKDMDFFGIKIDLDKNEVKGKEADISAPDAKVKTLVIRQMRSLRLQGRL